MTGNVCGTDGCGQPAPTATICRACTTNLRQALADVPSLVTDLDITLTRQAVMSDRNGKSRSAHRPLPYDPRASEAAWVLRNTLVGWVCELAGDNPDVTDTVADMARFLLSRVNDLAGHPAAGEAVDEITAAVADARQVTDRQHRRFTIGPCVMDCPGSLSAALAPSTDNQSWIICDTDTEHTWPQEQWLFLGNWIHSDRMSA